MMIRRQEWLLVESSTVHFSNLRAANTQTVLGNVHQSLSRSIFTHLSFSIYQRHAPTVATPLRGRRMWNSWTRWIAIATASNRYTALCKLAKDHRTAKQRPANMIHGASCQESTGPLAWLGKHASTTRVEPKQTSFPRD
jgi:hypothetical protein